MTVIQELAHEVGVHERTLRRGLAEGLVRGRRPSPRSVTLAPGEAAYLRAYWPLISGLREALRTERSLRLAVLIGSAARGTLGERSDVDVLVRLSDADWRIRDRLGRRLAGAAGRAVDLIPVDAARHDPLLFDAALREGRVLVDRDGEWPQLLSLQPAATRSAAVAARDLRDELHAMVAALSSYR